MRDLQVNDVPRINATHFIGVCYLYVILRRNLVSFNPLCAFDQRNDSHNELLLPEDAIEYPSRSEFHPGTGDIARTLERSEEQRIEFAWAN